MPCLVYIYQYFMLIIIIANNSLTMSPHNASRRTVTVQSLVTGMKLFLKATLVKSSY